MNWTIKALRILAMIMMGLTAAMNLLGGAGTFCAAFSSNVEYQTALQELMDYRWIYQILVVTTILVGLAGIWALIQLIRGTSKAYRFSMIVLGIGVFLGGTQFFTSLALRGKAVPANIKFYTNLVTLLVFLVFQIPGIKDKAGFSKPSDRTEKRSAAGAASILAGLTSLTIFGWAGPSHTYFGENWVFVFEMPLLVLGTALILGGFYVIYVEILAALKQNSAQLYPGAEQE